MVNFSEWFLVEEISEEFYKGSLQSLTAQEASQRALEFFYAAVRGEWETFLESQSSDNPEKEAEKLEKDRIKATRMQDLAWRVRWSAMLDRRDAISTVRSIYSDEWLPAKVEYENISSKKSSEWDFSGYEDEYEEKPYNTQIGRTLPSSLNSIAERIMPMLEKLGYLEEEEAKYGTENERIATISNALESASKEKGNDPPNNAVVKQLISNPRMRRDSLSKIFEELYYLLQKTAESTYRKMRVKQGFEGGEEKYASELQAEEILSDGLQGIIKMLQSRGSPENPWEENLGTFNMDAQKEPEKYLNIFKSRIKNPARVLRDKRRQDKTASGISTSSESMPLSIDNTFAGSEGEENTISVADPKGRDSLSSSIKGEVSNEIIEAFRQAMTELKSKSPDQAILACLWLGLQGKEPANCANTDGSISDQASAKRFIDAVRGAHSSSRQNPSIFLRNIGVDALVPGGGAGKSGKADWALIRLIKIHNIPTNGVLAGMPPGNLPQDWMPNYTKRHEFDPVQKEWWKYLNRVMDSLSKKVLPFIANRMFEILSEKKIDSKPKGWQSSCSWSLDKFIKHTFMDEIRSRTITITGSNPIKVIFFSKSKKLTQIRSYTISYDGEGIRIVQDGREGNLLYLDAPKNNIRCPKCGGRGQNCDECDGCGLIMDRIKIMSLERDIHSFLIKRTTNRTKNIG